MVAGLGQRTKRQHQSASSLEGQSFLHSAPAHCPHRRQHEHTVALATHPQFPFLDLRAVEGLKVHEIKIHGRCIQNAPSLECRLHRLPATEPSLCRCDRIKDCHVAAVMPLTQEIAQALNHRQECLHMRPVRHTEMVAGRSPFPEAPVGRVIQSVQREQVLALGKVCQGCAGQLFGGSPPAAVVIALEPDSRTQVEVRN